MGSLAVDIEKIWDKSCIKKSSVWLVDFIQMDQHFSVARRKFHQWAPLRIYVRKSSSMSPAFALRFHGQDVATLRTGSKGVCLNLDRSMISKTKRTLDKEFPFAQGSYPWKGPVGINFRRYFKRINEKVKGVPQVRIPEHRVESKFIQEMLKNDSTKFGGIGLRIQPVTVGGCPLQFPLPVSASTGWPVKTNGHIDILARRVLCPGKVVLSVWELKKPHAYAHAASQAYIYAYTLIKLLRSTIGSKWYRLFGFKGSIPNSLQIEAVVAITKDQLPRFEKEKKCLDLSGNLFQIKKDRIDLRYVCYNELERGILIRETNLLGVRGTK